MPRGTDHQELHDAAMSALGRLGYDRRFGKLDSCRSRQVYRLAKAEAESWFLVQSRHKQPETDRYLVGLIVDAIDRVDQVALFFEGEPTMFVIPAAFLREIHEKRKALGDSRYTGSQNEQWRVNIFVSDKQLSPQGSNDYRYDLEKWAVRPPGR